MKKQYPKPVVTKNSSGIEIAVIKEFCKGCGICVEFCPKDVLTIGSDLKVNVSKVEACNGDMLCELRCPDFAIFVTKPPKNK